MNYFSFIWAILFYFLLVTRLALGFVISLIWLDIEFPGAESSKL